ncbi:hypothetical protein ACO0RG_001277 [Hanseniaspora osmophila]|uniref:Putative aldehyde dehydrogenase-like protein n=1 Tax=Hanseniaspora osmophila TaxID=56408 RepID=A0A1E5RNW9_9ASCO|nr:putative aldehyde dehydrogenase-like protein [Hanseniaspora osmophila]
MLFKEITLPTGTKYEQPLGLFINNEFVESHSSERLPAYNPATGKVIVEVQEACAKKDVDLAVEVATKAFKSWKKVPAVEKRDMFFKLAQLVSENKQLLAEIESANSGKPVETNAKGDIDEMIDVFKYLGGWIDKVDGETHIPDDKRLCLTFHQPMGVVGCIVPFNYPLSMMTNKFAAIAAGNTTIFKSGDQTPISALFFATLVKKAGFPPGVFNLLSGKGSTVGDRIIKHPGIVKVAFTGSTAVGKMIQENTAKNLKPLSLECGGKSPAVVFDDCDFEQAIKWCALGIFFNTGQICSGTSKVYVQDTIYEKFIESMKKYVEENYIVGDPSVESTVVGPLISAKQHDRVTGYIKKSIEEGLHLVTGGLETPASVASNETLKQGYFVQPTIFRDLQPHNTIAKEEIFGPVLAIAKFSTYDEVIELCNDVDYGLGSAIFTTNLQKSIAFAKDIEAGIVWVNSSNDANSNCPFGGIKESGNGSKDLGSYTMLNYMNVKSVQINLSSKL